GSGVLTDGAVVMTTQRNSKFLYSLSETYTLDSTETGADHQIAELWIHARLKLGESEITHAARFGANSSSSSLNANGRYGSAQISMSAGVLSALRANSQNLYSDLSSSLPAYDGSSYIDAYTRLTDDGNGSLICEIWFNPSDLDNLGVADVSRSAAYVDSKVIDQIGIETWGVANATSYDSVKVGTELGDVIPEPATLSLVIVSSAACFLMRSASQL
ncbi:MAG: hypothetical protein AB7E95_01720, partial [Kiritimatiellales bacterium]